MQDFAALPNFDVSVNLTGGNYTAGTVLNVTLVLKNSSDATISENSIEFTVGADGSIPADKRIALPRAQTGCSLASDTYTTEIVVKDAPRDACGVQYSSTDYGLIRTVKTFTVDR